MSDKVFVLSCSTIYYLYFRSVWMAMAMYDNQPLLSLFFFFSSSPPNISTTPAALQYPI